MSRTSTPQVFIAAFIGTSLLLATSLAVAARNQRAAIHSNTCAHHLSFIYRGLRGYHDKYGKFPPAYIADASGKKLHSWRILILETLGEPLATEVYQAYRFDEPWDGPNNRKLLNHMPAFYACTSDHSTPIAGRSTTNYVVVTGPGAVFRPGGSLAISAVADIHDDTIILTETLPGIPWTEPKDLEFDSMSFELNDPQHRSIASEDRPGPGVMFLDGRLKRLGSTINADVVKSLIIAHPAPAKVPDEEKQKKVLQ